MSFRNVLTKITKAKEDAEEAAQTLRQAVDTGREQISVKKREMAYLREAPPPPEERIATHARLVDEKAHEWELAYWPGYLSQLDGSLTPEDLAGRVSSAPRPPRLPSNPGFDPDGARCFFQGDAMKADFRRALLARPYEAAPATGERPALLERLRGELVELETADEALVDELHAHGISFPHRDEVLTRREDERRAREREAERLKNEQWLAGQKGLGRLGTREVHHANFKPSRPAPTGREQAMHVDRVRPSGAGISPRVSLPGQRARVVVRSGQGAGRRRGGGDSEPDAREDQPPGTGWPCHVARRARRVTRDSANWWRARS
jgi:hypothetical protein